MIQPSFPFQNHYSKPKIQITFEIFYCNIKKLPWRPQAQLKSDFRLLTFGDIYLNFLENDDQLEISIITVSLTSQIITGIAALVVSRKYRGSRVFGRSYLFLAGAFFSVALGEIIYNVYLFVFEIDPFPPIADIFFFLLYPFTLFHLLININFFKVGIDLKSIFLISVLS